MKNKLEELKKQGITIYSHSRLSTMENCEYEYYNTYVLKNKGIENVYNILGSFLHDSIEVIYKDEMKKEELVKKFEEKLIELEMLNITFPNDFIKNSWINDMRHYINNFKKLDKKAILEYLVVFEVNGIYLQGYIDAIFPSEKGKPYVNIIDWKTSSKFTGKKIDEAGRQLLMYKIAIEELTPFKVDKVMWSMLKYINVCWKLKNGNVKKKMCNRGKWVKEMKNIFIKDLQKLDLPEFEIELLIDKAIEDNSIECLPKEIHEKYWLEDCFVEYEITDEKIEEFKQYIIDVVNKIESKDPNNENDWKPIKITKQNSFYCGNLCAHRKTCKYYREFLNENMDEFDKKEKKNKMTFEDLFG